MAVSSLCRFHLLLGFKSQASEAKIRSTWNPQMNRSPCGCHCFSLLKFSSVQERGSGSRDCARGRALLQGPLDGVTFCITPPSVLSFSLALLIASLTVYTLDYAVKIISREHVLCHKLQPLDIKELGASREKADNKGAVDRLPGTAREASAFLSGHEIVTFSKIPVARFPHVYFEVVSRYPCVGGGRISPLETNLYASAQLQLTRFLKPSFQGLALQLEAGPLIYTFGKTMNHSLFGVQAAAFSVMI